MGCSASVPVAAAYYIDPNFQKVRGIFDILKLTDHNVATLHTIFVAHLPEKSEVLSVETALDIFGYKDNKFLKQIFCGFNLAKKEGTMTFSHFVVVLWNFCTLDNHLATEIFELYKTIDGDKIEVIDDSNATRFLMETNHPYCSSMSKLFASLCRDKLPMQRLIFREFVKGHPEFVSGCKHFQRHIMRATLGEKEWDRIQQQRVVIMHSGYKTPEEILQIVEADVQKRDVIAPGTVGRGDGKRPSVPTLPDLSKTEGGGSEAPISVESDSTSQPSMFSSLIPSRDTVTGASQARLAGMDFSVLAAMPPPSVRRRQQRNSLDSIPSRRYQHEYAAIPSPMDRVVASDVTVGSGVEKTPEGEESYEDRKRKRRKNRQTFPVEVSDADKARDKIVSDLLPDATPSQYGSLGINFCDVKYKRDGFEFDHSNFLNNFGHIDEETKLHFEMKHQAPRHLGSNRKRELGNIGFVKY